MASSNKKEIKDIAELASLSPEELKNLNLEDFLVYVQEFEDEKTKVTIIALINIIQRLADGLRLDTPLLHFRKEYREKTDLEKRLDVIYGIIEKYNLELSDEQNKRKEELEIALERMIYTDISKVKAEIQTKKGDLIITNWDEIPEYKPFFSEYLNKKETLRKFFSEVCTLYTNTLQMEHKEDRAFKKYINVFLKTLETKDVLGTSTWFTDAVEEAFLDYAVGSRMLSSERAEEIRMKRRLNKEKAEKFIEETKQLKKERENNKKKGGK